MNFSLILKSEFDRQKYLFSRLYKTLDLSLEKREAHQQEIFQLAKEQIKLFGGNFLDSKDQKGAIGRALKFINLGLEYASKRTEGISNDEMFDLAIAKRILKNKSLIQLYQLGYQLFREDSKIAINLLEKSEIKIGDLFFRLINSAEYTKLKNLTDIEYCNGTLAEHASAVKIAFSLSKKYEIIPFLPINDLGLMIFKDFGSRQKGIYPTSEGLIDCLLLSLLIACMFRNKDNLFNFLDTQEANGLFQTLTQKNQSREELEWAVQADISIRRSAYENKKYRASNPESQKIFLIDILTVKPEEVEQFADTIFFESSIFAKKVVQIEHFFLEYFHLVQETLHIKKPAHFNNTIVNALHSTEGKIANEVKNFYRTLDDVNITNEEISKFWHQRVCFKYRKNDSSKEGIASRVRSEIQPKQLVQMPIDYIVTAVKYFVHWPEEKKKEFIDNLNPNRFINENSGNSENLIQFLKYISSGTISGGATYIEIVIDKINWTRVHPSIISEIWGGSDDEIRNALFKHREKFKMTYPALRDYYISDFSDQRLFEYLLDKIAKEGSIKESAWNSLAYASQNLKAESVVTSKRKEWEKQQKKTI